MTNLEAARILFDRRNSNEQRVNALSVLDGNPQDQGTLDWYRELEKDTAELDLVAFELWNDGEYDVPHVDEHGNAEHLDD